MPERTVIHVKMGRQGRVVIPSAMRRELGLEPGDDLSARVDNGQLVLEPPSAALARAREHFSGRSDEGKSLTDELIDDRRAEARLEEERWQRLGFD